MGRGRKVPPLSAFRTDKRLELSPERHSAFPEKSEFGLV